ncbi:hypothetical protein Sjap_025333 [Stephania japonica]|uniref:Gnk2-homologous domain-containing protein n=1 Tax=Stephania japonica TaxID=461633 RepID=A0AAP0E505_9MAGN
MHSIIYMFYSSTLPLPNHPGFFLKRAPNVANSGTSSSASKQSCSVNETFRSAPLHVIILLFLVLHTAISTNPLLHICSTKAGINHTTYPPYNNNLNILISSLTHEAPLTGFALDTIGQGKDSLNGLALCRGDVPSRECKSCIVEAGREISKRCPNDDNGGIIWYDNCMFKYSNKKFFGKVDYKNRFYMYNLQNVSTNAESFNEKTKELLSKLADKAELLSPMSFAVGEEEIGDSVKLYGLVQCTGDLSGKMCKKCLDSAISEIGSCCDGKRGGRVVGGSCNFRYELYPFVRSSY